MKYSISTLTLMSSILSLQAMNQQGPSEKFLPQEALQRAIISTIPHAQGGDSTTVVTDPTSSKTVRVRRGSGSNSGVVPAFASTQVGSGEPDVLFPADAYDLQKRIADESYTRALRKQSLQTEGKS